MRAAAEEYAEKRRHDVEAEAARIVADAQRVAAEERDAAERDAAARRQEAEALYEQQRAKAAAAAADFEATLAERRAAHHRGVPGAAGRDPRAARDRAGTAEPAARPGRRASSSRPRPRRRRILEDAAARADALVGEAAGHRRADPRRHRPRARGRDPAPRQHQRAAGQRPARCCPRCPAPAASRSRRPSRRHPHRRRPPRGRGGRGARDQPGLSRRQDRSGVVVPLIHSSKNAVSSSPVVSSTQSK